MKASGGIYAANVTPVDAEGGVDTKRLGRHASWLLRHGCHGIGLFGTTGEAVSFAVPQRQAALEAVLASGIPAESIVVGIGTCAKADTLALARHAVVRGCRRLLMQPPFFYKKVGDDGLFAAFAEVIDGLGDRGVELLLYHFPQVTQVPITRPVIERLVAAYPATVRGLKDSSGDLAHTTGLARDFPELSIFAGNDSHLLKVLEAGGAGTISAAANLNCAASRAVYDAFQAGDMAAAAAGMGKVDAVRKVLEAVPLVPSLKQIIATASGDPAWARVRPPLTPLDEAAATALEAALVAQGCIYEPDLEAVAAA